MDKIVLNDERNVTIGKILRSIAKDEASYGGTDLKDVLKFVLNQFGSPNELEQLRNELEQAEATALSRIQDAHKLENEVESLSELISKLKKQIKELKKK